MPQAAEIEQGPAGLMPSRPRSVPAPRRERLFSGQRYALTRPPRIAEAHGAHGERVDHPAALPAALQRAAAAARGGQQALVNVICR
jgi:thiamine pyrophosphate-dependent acetolactate synthase large subunit-like protein